VGAVHKSIEDGVSDGRIIEPGVPVVDRQLAGDEGGFAAAAVVDDFEQIVPRRLIKRGHAPVVKDQYIDASQLHEQAAEAAVGMRDAKRLRQARHALVKHWKALATGLLSECAGQPRFADTGRAGEQDALALADPVAARQVCDETFVDAAATAVTDVFEASAGMLELGCSQQPLQSPAITPAAFAVDQQAESIFKREILAGRQQTLLFQGARHAVQLEHAQLVEGGMGQHAFLRSVSGGWIEVVRRAAQIVVIWTDPVGLRHGRR